MTCHSFASFSRLNLAFAGLVAGSVFIAFLVTFEV